MKPILTFVLLFCVTTLAAGERRLSLDEYRDKMQGAWIGQMVGVAASFSGRTASAWTFAAANATARRAGKIFIART